MMRNRLFGIDDEALRRKILWEAERDSGGIWPALVGVAGTSVLCGIFVVVARTVIAPTFWTEMMLWMLAVGGTQELARWLRRRKRFAGVLRRKLIDAGRCTLCGYLLRERATEHCPECGEAVCEELRRSSAAE